MDRSEKPAATLVSLPIELKQAILSYLPDLRTLRRAVKAHSSLKDALKDHSNPIIKQILFRTLPQELLPEAFATHMSKYQETRNRESVEMILCDYFKSLINPPQQLKFQDALAIEQFFHIIKWFSSIFITRALRKHPITREDQKHWTQPSESEIRRIERNFYRFELYSNIFRAEDKQRKPIIDEKGQRELFFSQFAPWENEQLVCVHDCLLQILDICELYCYRKHYQNIDPSSLQRDRRA
jgi:hypothetical protein